MQSKCSRLCIFRSLVISPRLAAYLEKQGYSALPMDALDYVTKIVNDILARRRKHVERRHDFIQIMVDHEEAVKDEEKTQPVTEENKEQGIVLKKSMLTDLEDHSQSNLWIIVGLSDKEIFAQALFFMIAGYETTTAFMSFFFYVMSTEPVIQEKIYEEIRHEIGDVCHPKN
jgi:cytochrome P450